MPDQSDIGDAKRPAPEEADGVLRALILFKFAYLALVLLILAIWPDLDRAAFHRMLARWPREGEPTFWSHFATWDGAHYLFLSEVGYTRGSPSCAFFPLWPFLVRAGAWLLGGSHIASGLLLANAISVAGVWLFHRVVAEKTDKPTANLATILLLAFPGALFFQFIYTEALFFALLMALCLALARGRLGWAALAAFLLPLTRAPGLFCVVPLAWRLLTGRRRGGDYLCVLSPVAGYITYLGLMGVLTGNPLEGFEAQKHWPGNSVWNIFNIPKFVAAFLGVEDFHSYGGSLLDRGCFFVLAASLYPLYRFDKEWFLWAAVLGVLPAMISSFASFTRYAEMAFPMFVVLAMLLKDRAPGWKRWYLAGILAALQLVLLERQLNFVWAG
jgi:hypothetical protein